MAEMVIGALLFSACSSCGLYCTWMLLSTNGGGVPPGEGLSGERMTD